MKRPFTFVAPNLSIYEDGTFASMVAEELAECLKGAHAKLATLTSDFPDLLIILGHHPLNILAERYSAMFTGRIAAILPAFLTHTTLSVGPLFLEGIPGCRECLRCRRLQHASSKELAISKHFTINESLRAEGFLRAHSVILAAMITSYLLAYVKEKQHTVIHEWHIFRELNQQFDLIPVHACTTCGIYHDQGEGRRRQDLRQLVQHLVLRKADSNALRG